MTSVYSYKFQHLPKFQYVVSFPAVIDFYFHSTVIRKDTLYNLNLLKFTETGFITQHIAYAGIFSVHLRRMYTLLFWGRVYRRYLVGLVSI